MEKTYEPSKKKLEKLRKEGNLPKSQYLTQALAVVALICVLLHSGPRTWVAIRMLLECSWREAKANPLEILKNCADFCAITIVQVLVVITIVGCFCEFAQLGFKNAYRGLRFDLNRLNPVTGLLRISCVWGDIAQLILRLIAFAFIFAFVLIELVGSSEYFLSLSLPKFLVEMISEMFKAAFLIAALLICSGLLDFNLKRRKWLRSAGMSHEELRKESREEEGDPLLKAERRAAHEALLREDIIKRVRQSKVIIVE